MNHPSRRAARRHVVPTWLLLLIAAIGLLGVIAQGGDRAHASDQDTPLPAAGVVSLERTDAGWTITLESADASEVKLITPSQAIACSEHEGQPKNGHPLCDRTSYTFPVDAECVMVQVDWTGNVHNSSDPRRCSPKPTPSPTPTVTPSPTPTPTPTPTATPEPSPTATPEPTSTPSPSSTPSASRTPEPSRTAAAPVAPAAPTLDALAATGGDEDRTRTGLIIGVLVIAAGAIALAADAAARAHRRRVAALPSRRPSIDDGSES